MTDMRARVRIGFAVIALLVVGAAMGVHADRVLHGQRVTGIVRFSDVHDDPVGMLAQAIDLTPEQRARITALLQRRQPAIDTAWHEARRHIGATVDSVVNEIAAELDSSQITRFRQLVHELHTSGAVRLREETQRHRAIPQR